MNTRIVDVDDLVFEGSFLSFSKTVNSNNLTIGLKSVEMLKKNSIFSSKQFNFIDFNWETNDKYLYSYYVSLFNITYVLTSSFLMKTFVTKKDTTIYNFIDYILLPTTLLTKTQYSFDIYKDYTQRSSFITGAFFLKSNLECYTADGTKWKYKPALGIELIEQYIHIGYSIELGIEKPFVLSGGKLTQSDFKIFAGIKLLYGEVKEKQNPLLQ